MPKSTESNASPYFKLSTSIVGQMKDSVGQRVCVHWVNSLVFLRLCSFICQGCTYDCEHMGSTCSVPLFALFYSEHFSRVSLGSQQN